jgi:hypothetical protein
LEKIKKDLENNYEKHKPYPNLSDNLTFDLEPLSECMMISSQNIPQFLHQEQKFVQLSGLVIKFNPMKNHMIFVKVLDISDLVHVYKMVLCFNNKKNYEMALSTLKKGYYLWTAPQSKNIYFIYFFFKINDFF